MYQKMTVKRCDSTLMTRQKKMSLCELNYTAIFLIDSVVFSLKGHCHGDGPKKTPAHAGLSGSQSKVY